MKWKFAVHGFKDMAAVGIYNLPILETWKIKLEDTKENLYRQNSQSRIPPAPNKRWP